MKKMFRNSKGFSLMEVMVTTGIMAVISAGMARMIVNMNMDNKKNQIRMVATSLKNEVQSLVQNDTLWLITRSHVANTSFACLDGANPFCGTTVVTENNEALAVPVLNHFAVYRSAAIALTPNDADFNRRGYTLAGVPCRVTDAGIADTNADNVPDGDDKCPFVLELYHVPQCTGNCSSANSSLRVSGRLNYYPNSERLKIPFNSDMYSFNFTRGASITTSFPEQFCRDNIKGTWNSLTSICALDTDKICEDLTGLANVVTDNGVCTTTSNTGTVAAASCSGVGGVWGTFAAGIYTPDAVTGTLCYFPGLISACRELGGSPQHAGSFQCDNITSTGGTNGTITNLCTKLGGTFSGDASSAASCNLTAVLGAKFDTLCTTNGGLPRGDSNSIGGRVCIWNKSYLHTKLQSMCNAFNHNADAGYETHITAVWNGVTNNCDVSISNVTDTIRTSSDVRNSITGVPSSGAYSGKVTQVYSDAANSARCPLAGQVLVGFSTAGVPECVNISPTTDLAKKDYLYAVANKKMIASFSNLPGGQALLKGKPTSKTWTCLTGTSNDDDTTVIASGYQTITSDSRPATDSVFVRWTGHHNPGGSVATAIGCKPSWFLVSDSCHYMGGSTNAYIWSYNSNYYCTGGDKSGTQTATVRCCQMVPQATFEALHGF
ncbi:MAG: prepilin-type N-terminal cleavage/methylation domain-containing protein [Bdellovibrionaceae bacterium]|jgi:prepilin-type N-terminal cleavage/methylation domain-containing protein|nr:prepilin-type N-terminal cleavage/methylation domain-containing protein [Pseudobdellovibrionaceae bacterium]